VGVELDETDRRIIGALQVDGRATFKHVANVLKLPERTVSRRGQQLLENGLLQVTGLIEREMDSRKEAVVVRIKCAPGLNRVVATALSHLPESIFVYITSGENEIISELFGSPQRLAELLLDQLPGINGVSGVTSSSCLKYYRTAAQWNPQILSDSERESFSANKVPPAIQEIELGNEDRAILEVISKNGRATFDQIARACGLAEATARRKTTTLLESGALSIHAVVNPATIGFPYECWMWLQTSPSETGKIAERLLLDSRVRYLATVTGEYQILLEVAMKNKKELNAFINNEDGWADNVSAVHSTLMIEAFKRSGRIINSIDRIAH
jgi:Lrp/AsnC family transcriptional regulator for asnA, asnC and gidA